MAAGVKLSSVRLNLSVPDFPRPGRDSADTQETREPVCRATSLPGAGKGTIAAYRTGKSRRWGTSYLTWFLLASLPAGGVFAVIVASNEKCEAYGLALTKTELAFGISPTLVLEPFVTTTFLGLVMSMRSWKTCVSSPLDFCTRVYAIVGWLASCAGPMFFCSHCSCSSVSGLGLKASIVCVVLSWLLLNYMALLRCRMLSEVLPRWTGFAEGLFWCMTTSGSVCGGVWIYRYSGDVQSGTESEMPSDMLWYGSVAVGFTLALLFNATVVACLLETAKVVLEEKDADDGALRQAATWTRRSAWTMAAASSTMLLAVLSVSVGEAGFLYLESEGSRLLCFFAIHACLCIDATTNSWGAAMLAGLLEPQKSSHHKQVRHQGTLSVEGNLRLVAWAAEAARRRADAVQHKLRVAMEASTVEAATVAALIGNRDPAELIDMAAGRFRCVEWSTLQEYPEVILSTSDLDGRRLNGELYDMSTECALTCCDRFLSHSWHDFPDLKWACLQEWCARFEETQQRSPCLWLDKLCINQSSIASDLECLPIFLAGCQGMLIMAGNTYTSRLWCVAELFVYTSLRDTKEQAMPEILILARSECEAWEVRQSWFNFDAAKCSCAFPVDKLVILAVISQHGGGVAAFNKKVMEISEALWHHEHCGTTMAPCAMQPIGEMYF